MYKTARILNAPNKSRPQGPPATQERKGTQKKGWRATQRTGSSPRSTPVMLQLLGSLFFGGPQEAPSDAKHLKARVLEADEEGWVLLGLPDGATVDSSPTEELLIQCPDASSPSSALEDSVASLVSSVRMPATASSGGQIGTRGQATQGVAPRPGSLTKVTLAGQVQRAQARASWGSLGRSRLHRHNYVCQRGRWHTAHTRSSALQQPCPRNLSH
ncbi:uncharacterized protein LOC125748015 isoform X2 [Brienomyrus brachyistius]|nr:uncharacterized protein LOC125748015 isoform X2 [Brienomyrus brachyistius]XP_048879761.1 uncharacterized protein LOC125748015 isoform X2 [Brienomyrus brachyistius]